MTTDKNDKPVISKLELCLGLFVLAFYFFSAVADIFSWLSAR